MPRLARPSSNQLTWIDTKRSAPRSLAMRARSRSETRRSPSRVVVDLEAGVAQLGAESAADVEGELLLGQPVGVRVPWSPPPWPGSTTMRRTATGKTALDRRAGSPARGRPRAGRARRGGARAAVR
jgi:hypothetical protein